MIGTLILLTIIERAYVLAVFGFRYIGIDDALIQQVAIDYGHGIFREPFLYGQNYNPMLEAVLAAPFVRLGAAPWIVLPIITSVLGLLPFWSFSLFALKKHAPAAALVLAVFPLLLPIEWGLISTMPRGWVHGLAGLALMPWLFQLRNPWLRHGSTALIAVTCVLINANAAPIVAGALVWLALRDGRMPSFWISNMAAMAAGYALHSWALAWYQVRPGSVIHPLNAADLAFDPALLKDAVLHLNTHVLHLHPFGSMGWLNAVLIIAVGIVLFRRDERCTTIAILLALSVMLIGLGLPKLHEGCASVFFPKSRMLLGLPLLTAVCVAMLLRDAVVSRRAAALLLPLTIVGLFLKSSRVQAHVNREMARQECAWVREEPLSVIRGQCEIIAETAFTYGCDLIVPVRWPGIKEDHRSHFTAHFTCYACAQLVHGFPDVYGAGFDRRSWIRDAHDRTGQGRVLFVGGDVSAWQRAMASDMLVEDVSDGRLRMHIARCDSLTPSQTVLRLGVDDDLGR